MSDSAELHAPLVLDIARGPYVTTFPSLLDCDPAYSSEDRTAIDIYRGRAGLPAERLVSRRIKTLSLGPVDFERGLAMLPGDDIERILASDERRHLDELLPAVQSGTGNVDELAVAVHAYRRRIDDAVVHVLRMARPEERFQIYQADQLNPFEREALQWIRFVCWTAFDNALRGLPELLGFAFERFISIRRPDPQLRYLHDDRTQVALGGNAVGSVR